MRIKTLHLLLTVLAVTMAASPAAAQVVSGGGETVITGGSGTPPQPLKGLFGLRIDELPNGGFNGTFDCLAVATETASGPGSAIFNQNVMYVTGRITKVSALDARAASFSGTATVTGVGFGVVNEVPFDCRVTAPKASGVGVTAGGAGATMTLSIAGLTFNEILISGGIKIEKPKRPFKSAQ